MSNKREMQNLVQQCDELRNKIQLLEGDKKAYYENSQFTIKKNNEKIARMRKENKELRKAAADKLAADEHVVNEGLKDHPTDRNALRRKPGQVAISVMDQRCCDLVKKLDAEKHATARKQKKLNATKQRHNEMVKDSADALATDAGESEDAQNLRNLENRLDKANLKCREAEHIRRTYVQIKAKLQDEHKTFENILDDSEREIKRLQQEKTELNAMHNDAVISRDAAKQEMERQEKQVYEERKKREIELQKLRKEAEEKRILQERIERRIANQSLMGADEVGAIEQRVSASSDDDQRKILTYEEAFQCIKEATGVTDTQEVVWRFENQDETTARLEDLKAKNGRILDDLQADRDRLQGEYDEARYSGEAKGLRGQAMLDEFRAQLAKEERRQEENQERLEKYSKILTNSKSGVEHLTKKLHPIKLSASSTQKLSSTPASNEYSLDQLAICEEKLMKLLEELDHTGKDMDTITKQMEHEEFHNTAETRLPKYNTRVKLPLSQKESAAYDDGDESGDDTDVLTREGLKKQALQIVEAKTRRRPVGKKKKGGK